jgi:preprotein translocase SecE subunit
VARNRKRAKERRARRPEAVISARRERDDGTPTPIAHAAPDVELAEAQLALGRPEPDLDVEPEAGPEPEPEAEPEAEDAAQNGELADADAIDLGAGRGAGRGGGRELDQPGRGGSTAVRAAQAAGPAATGPAAVVEPREGLVSRLIAFLQGSWRELQRVQWPDRRQVWQATGVVIGFVILAGVFLGVADLVSNQLVKLILK